MSYTKNRSEDVKGKGKLSMRTWIYWIYMNTWHMHKMQFNYHWIIQSQTKIETLNHSCRMFTCAHINIYFKIQIDHNGINVYNIID